MRNAIKITALKYYLQYDIYLMKNNLFYIYVVPNLVMDRESEMGAENKQDIKDFTPKAGEGWCQLSIVRIGQTTTNYNVSILFSDHLCTALHCPTAALSRVSVSAVILLL